MLHLLRSGVDSSYIFFLFQLRKSICHFRVVCVRLIWLISLLRSITLPISRSSLAHWNNTQRTQVKTWCTVRTLAKSKSCFSLVSFRFVITNYNFIYCLYTIRGWTTCEPIFVSFGSSRNRDSNVFEWVRLKKKKDHRDPLKSIIFFGFIDSLQWNSHKIIENYGESCWKGENEILLLRMSKALMVLVLYRVAW